MLKSISKYSYFSFIPFTLLGVVTIALFSLQLIPAYYLLFTVVGWVLIAGLGVEVGMHRMFSHNHYPNISRWKENIILFLGCLGAQGSSISWAATHRQHHKYSDKEQDLHSPQIHSKWHAFFGWTHSITENNNSINFKYVANLLRKENHLWFHKHQLSILWGVPLLLCLYDWKLSLALVCLPAGISVFINNLINVVCHIKFIGNYRNYETNDCSQNNIFFGLFGWGLGYHNNHHKNPGSFLHKTKDWEIDPCAIFVPILKVKS